MFGHGHALRALTARWLGLPVDRRRALPARHRDPVRAGLRARDPGDLAVELLTPALDGGPGVGTVVPCGRRRLSAVPDAGRGAATAGRAPTTAPYPCCGDPSSRRTTPSPRTWSPRRGLPDVPALADEPGLADQRLRRSSAGPTAAVGDAVLLLRHQRRPTVRSTCWWSRRSPAPGSVAAAPGSRAPTPDPRSAAGPPSARVRVDGRPVALWSVSTSDRGRGLRPLGVRRGGVRALAVAGAAAGLGDVAAARGVDHCRTWPDRPGVGRDAVRWPGPVVSRSGERPA